MLDDSQRTFPGAAWGANRAVLPITLCVVLAYLVASAPACSENHVRAELIADVQAVEAGTPFRVGVLFTIEPHAHIYWRYPGSSGLATGIEWRAPKDLAIGALQWPNPERYEIVEIDDISYGYAREVLLIAEVSVSPESNAADAYTIEAEPYWLVCLDDGQCIPESASLRLRLGAGREGPSVHAAAFDRYSARVPRPLNEIAGVSLNRTRPPSGELHFVAEGPWRFALGSGGAVPRFFPDDGPAWNLVRPKAGDDALPASVRFERLEKEKAAGRPMGGVATLPLHHRESGARKTVYLRIVE